MKHDIFVGLQKIIDKDCALVRVVNQGGVPYSIILEQQPNGEFWEVCCTPTLGDNDSISESEMINKYLAAKELGQKQLGDSEVKIMQINVEPCSNLIPENVTLADIKSYVDHLDEECKEVLDALVDVAVNPNEENILHLGEELDDVATMATTTLVALEKLPQAPENLKKIVEHFVILKNYMRGYHSTARI